MNSLAEVKKIALVTHNNSNDPNAPVSVYLELSKADIENIQTTAELIRNKSDILEIHLGMISANWSHTLPEYIKGDKEQPLFDEMIEDSIMNPSTRLIVDDSQFWLQMVPKGADDSEACISATVELFELGNMDSYIDLL